MLGIRIVFRFEDLRLALTLAEGLLYRLHSTTIEEVNINQISFVDA